MNSVRRFMTEGWTVFHGIFQMLQTHVSSLVNILQHVQVHGLSVAVPRGAKNRLSFIYYLIQDKNIIDF
jgi:hypothetical protein